MSESQRSVESITKKRKVETSEMAPLKPCDASSQKKSMLLKPCDTLSEKHPCDTMDVDEVEEEEDDFDDSVLTINVGQHLDLKALLSSKHRDYLISPITAKRVPISSLIGNYVLVCPFLLPCHDKSCTPNICQSLQALYSELTHLGIAHIVKLVVVLKLNPPLDESSFHAFFSRLSLDCLTIPFSDPVSPHRICLSFDFSPKWSFSDLPQLALHPNGIVLQYDITFLNKYGALSFPFTRDHFDNIDRQHRLIELELCSSKTPVNPKELLKCDSLSRIANKDDRVQTSVLADTTVGLYLYIDGSSMDLIQDIHKKCILKGLNFEIVLVPLPFERHDPAVFCDLMKKSALENSNSTSSSWWVYPFNDKICRSLWRLVECCIDDQLIVLPPGKFISTRPGDVYGKQIAFRYGIDAYPFTRDVIVERKFAELRSFTLESLLGDIHMSDLDLHNKNVVLYLDNPKSYYGSRDYNEILAKYPGTKVIFSPFGKGIGNFRDIGWSILPEELSESVIDRIFPEPDVTFGEPNLVTFGKDGKILSRFAQLRLPRRSTSSASIFDDRLHHEILGDLTTKLMAESCEEE